MTDLRDILPPPGRSNVTTLLDSHPADHNAIVDGLNGLGLRVDALETAAQYRVYDTLADRDADISAHVDGMLTWAISERTVAVWNGEWTVLAEPFTAFSPHLWIGTLEFNNVTPTSGTAYQSGFRRMFGSCEFYIAARFGELGPSQSGNLIVMPPVRPTDTGSGPFGNAYCVVPEDGAVGGMSGAFNGSAAQPAPSNGDPLVIGQLAIAMPGTGGLMDRGDMGSGNGSISGGNNGEFDVFMSGRYPMFGFVV